jgi:uncharacterized protein YkwD
LTEDYLVLGSEAHGDLVIRNPTVSRRHALIRRRADGYGWEILDLGSTNGTSVNGRRIDSCTPLTPGDRIMLGAVAIEVRALTPSGGSLGRSARAKPRAVSRTTVHLVGVLALSVLGFLAYIEFRPILSSNTPPASSPTPLPHGAIPTVPSLRAIPLPHSIAPASAYSPAPETTSTSHAAAGRLATVSEPWLARINFFRRLAKLGPIADDPTLSQGDFKHARYLVKNFAAEIKRNDTLGALMHTESPDKPWYTSEGLKAAQNSDVEQWYDTYPGASRLRSIDAIDAWLRGPFHRLSILDPGLSEAGYGAYCENGVCASALELPQGRSVPGRLASPVMFPPQDAVMPFSRMINGEWPDPLASCPGYHWPAGLPITLQLGMFVPTNLSAHALVLNGEPVEHCAFDARSYSNPNSADQDWGRKVLAGYGAIVLIPRAPLRRGATYAVSITAGGQSYNWSFTISAAGHR